jgi:hypothetical protein
VSSYELIGNFVEVVADNLRLGADFQNIIANTLDQSGLPTRRDGAEGVPCVAGDKTEPGRPNRKLPLDVGIGFARRFVMLHTIRTEAPLKEIDNAAMFKLAGLNLEQIVGESEEPETCITQLA